MPNSAFLTREFIVHEDPQRQRRNLMGGALQGFEETPDYAPQDRVPVIPWMMGPSPPFDPAYYPSRYAPPLSSQKIVGPYVLPVLDNSSQVPVQDWEWCIRPLLSSRGIEPDEAVVLSVDLDCAGFWPDILSRKSGPRGCCAISCLFLEP